MLKKIRDIINKNRLYSWMVVFIIFTQAYAVLLQSGKPAEGREQVLTSEEFKVQLEKRQEAIRGLLLERPQLAAEAGYLFLLILVILISGCVFFADYIFKRRNNIEIIPRTLDETTPLWGIADILKVVILFIFFEHFFLLFSHTLRLLFRARAFDRRTSIVASTLFMDILAFMFVLRFVIAKYGQGVKALGVSARGLMRNIAVAVYSYVSFLPILAIVFFGIVALARAFNYTPPPEPIYELLFEEKRPGLLAVISVLVAVLGPFIEEVFFRGFLYGAVKKRFNAISAIIVSGFLFSLLHTNLLGFIPILIFGTFLAYLREKTGSLVPSITVHIVHNTALALLAFLVRQLTAMAM